MFKLASNLRECVYRKSMLTIMYYVYSITEKKMMMEQTKKKDKRSQTLAQTCNHFHVSAGRKRRPPPPPTPSPAPAPSRSSESVPQDLHEDLITHLDPLLRHPANKPADCQLDSESESTIPECPSIKLKPQRAVKKN
ncbi:hypothetical protein KQX54_016133 [Cotesia glomerata]|uniref:Uncharacterized protein n=1 Tax=Cotesia glomerata TaxID=32391 RepID=A0AAV7HTF9_COTGL|nr:hypothetical protein KQX54_016133 [Cotesia glomerata]